LSGLSLNDLTPITLNYTIPMPRLYGAPGSTNRVVLLPRKYIPRPSAVPHGHPSGGLAPGSGLFGPNSFFGALGTFAAQAAALYGGITFAAGMVAAPTATGAAAATGSTAAAASPLTQGATPVEPVQLSGPGWEPEPISPLTTEPKYPVQLAGPDAPPTEYQPLDLPQTLSPHAHRTLVDQITARVGDTQQAWGIANKLYSAVRGGRSPAVGGSAPMVYQRTTQPAPSVAKPPDTGGLGANLTPALKQLTLPAILGFLAYFL
jgi:hypothetical protein